MTAKPRFPRRRQHDAPLTLADRLLFGGLAAVIGAVVGFVACVFVAMVFEVPPPLLRATLLSAGYFFAVGALRGAEAGTHVGDALSAVFALGAARAGADINIPDSTQHSRWASFWVLAPWVLGMIVLFMMG